MPGLDAGQWVPAVVKLPAAGPGWRFVTALPGPADAPVRAARDWRALPDLIQSAVPVTVTGSAAGLMQMTPNAPLAAGEYGVVLRPAFDQPLSGVRVMAGVAEGVPFGAVWRFAIR
jgi:hypothetical protein